MLIMIRLFIIVFATTPFIAYYVYKYNHYRLITLIKVIIIIIMKFEAMTNESIAAEIGQRIEQMRLEQNLTQQQLADEIGLSRVSYRKLVGGAGKFENIIAVLRALGRLDLVEQFVPETVFSPMEQLKLKGKQRQRATGAHAQKGGSHSRQQKPGLDW